MNCKYFVFAKVKEMTKVYFKDKSSSSSSSMEYQSSKSLYVKILQ